MASRRTPSRSRSDIRLRQRRRRIASFAALVLVVATSPWWSQALSHVSARKLMAWHSHFRVSQVQVTGTNVLSTEEIVKLAAIPARHSMFGLPFRDIEKRIRKNPWVKSVHVRRRLPDTVELQVAERVPVAAVRSEQLMVLTEDSIAIAPPPEDWVWDLPLLTPPRAVKLEHGARVKDQSVLNMLQQTALARSCAPAIWRDISELYYGHNQIHVVLDRPRADILAGHGVSALAWIGLQRYIENAELDSSGSSMNVDLRIPGKLIVAREPKETMEHDAG